jgi:hypothetical protein
MAYSFLANYNVILHSYNPISIYMLCLFKFYTYIHVMGPRSYLELRADCERLDLVSEESRRCYYSLNGLYRAHNVSL